MASVDTVNVAGPRPAGAPRSGIDKQPSEAPVAVRDPGPITLGLGSGLVGDRINNQRVHGGADQAVYAFAREDLDHWQQHLDRVVPNGYFGENLTTRGIDVNEARVGEQWRIGADLVLQVTTPLVPCATFRAWVGAPGWLKTFTDAARPGAYLRVVAAGEVSSGDQIEVIRRPAHDVTISLVFRAIMNERELLADLLPARDDLPDGLRELVDQSTNSSPA